MESPSQACFENDNTIKWRGGRRIKRDGIGERERKRDFGGGQKSTSVKVKQSSVPLVIVRWCGGAVMPTTTPLDEL